MHKHKNGTVFSMDKYKVTNWLIVPCLSFQYLHWLFLLIFNFSHKNIVFIAPVKYFQQAQVMQYRLRLWNAFLCNPRASLAAWCIWTSLHFDNPWEDLWSQLIGSFHSDWKKTHLQIFPWIQKLACELWFNSKCCLCYIHFANCCS